MQHTHTQRYLAKEAIMRLLVANGDTQKSAWKKIDTVQKIINARKYTSISNVLIVYLGLSADYAWIFLED